MEDLLGENESYEEEYAKGIDFDFVKCFDDSSFGGLPGHDAWS